MSVSPANGRSHREPPTGVYGPVSVWSLPVSVLSGAATRHTSLWGKVRTGSLPEEENAIEVPIKTGRKVSR